LAFIFFHPSTLMPLASTTASSAAPLFSAAARK
jgi:hypothetical protein